YKAPMQETTWQPEQVELILNQHIGAPASPSVEIGQRVVEGECIAQMKDGALGAALHASISGVVSQVGSRSITLVRE
ncbi:MAG: electron transport complex protein RnfC, partial [Enterobacterales bacterium]|nr:electron transport complex protein RnfC [Enterobacterales bacterium]